MVVVLPQGVELKSERWKDRLTYIHQHCQIDLTQVTHVPSPQRLSTNPSPIRRRRMNWR